MWRELLSAWSSDCSFTAPATPSALLRAEEMVGIALPRDLTSLLLESDGVNDKYGMPMVLAAADIARTNNDFRANEDFAELYMPFDPLLLFGSYANSDYFAYRILKGGFQGNDIYRWEHETDSRTWVAPSLERYLEWVLSGRIAG